MDLVKFRYMAGAAAVAGIVAGVAVSVQAAGDNGNATATIIAPIAIANTTDLAFANVVASGDADTAMASALEALPSDPACRARLAAM